MSKLYLFSTVFVLYFASYHGAILTWNILNPGKFLQSSTNFKSYASQRISALRNLRNQLTESENGGVFNGTSVSTAHNVSTVDTPESSTALKSARSEEKVGNMFKQLEMLLPFTGPLKKMISSKQSVEALATMMTPKSDMLKKLLDIKGHLEPGLKRYLTDKYNWFLTSLIPYSENIGVPPFVLNSMKIPQDFDPRWQFIKSLLESKGGLEKFLHAIAKGNALNQITEVIESRSGDATELLSDQEPDATSKAYRKHQQQLYLSSFNKRVPKPENRFSANGAGMPSFDYENILDQQGQFGHVSYDARSPEEIYNEAYYNAGSTGIGTDMAMSASGHGGRGHGHGGGYGGGHNQASYGGFLDPFTILGGLAFLTYLGLMLQSSLNRNATGRSFPSDYHRVPVVPVNLKFDQTLESHSQGRHVRSVVVSNHKKVAIPLTIDQVVDDVTRVWKEIEDLKTHPNDFYCSRYKLCKIAAMLKEINLQSMFSSILISNPDDQPFVEYILNAKTPTKKLCDQWSHKCVN